MKSKNIYKKATILVIIISMFAGLMIFSSPAYAVRSVRNGKITIAYEDIWCDTEIRARYVDSNNYYYFRVLTDEYEIRVITGKKIAGVYTDLSTDYYYNVDSFEIIDNQIKLYNGSSVLRTINDSSLNVSGDWYLYDRYMVHESAFISYDVAADTTPPSQVSGITYTETTPGTINLSWNTSTDNVGVVGYDIEYSLLPDFSTKNATTSTTNSKQLSLSLLTLYYVRVRAYDAADNKGLWSPTLSFTTSTNIPNYITMGVSNSTVSFNNIDIKWNYTGDYNSNAVIKYRYKTIFETEYRPTDGLIMTRGDNFFSASIDASTLLPNTEYSIELFASDVDNVGSIPSAYISFTTLPEVSMLSNALVELNGNNTEVVVGNTYYWFKTPYFEEYPEMFLDNLKPIEFTVTPNIINNPNITNIDYEWYFKPIGFIKDYKKQEEIFTFVFETEQIYGVDDQENPIFNYYLYPDDYFYISKPINLNSSFVAATSSPFYGSYGPFQPTDPLNISFLQCGEYVYQIIFDMNITYLGGHSEQIQTAVTNKAKIIQPNTYRGDWGTSQ